MSTEGEVATEILGPSASEVIRTSFVRFWSSVKLAVVLIVAIALASTLGTIVPQGDPGGILAIEGMSDRTKQILVGIRAYNVYYSAWYLGLLALFFLNLAVCTYVRVWPRLKYALRRPQDIPVPARDHMPEQQTFPGVGVDQLAAELKKAGFRSFPSADGGFAADRNRLFRFAPMVVHLGLFMILLGGLIAGLMGFKHSFPVMPGESVAARQTIKDASTRGALTPIPSDFKVRLDKFWMTRYDNGSIRQFFSTLSILEGDKVMKQQTIRVNEPLVYQGVYYYQSFWGIGGQSFVVDRGIRSEVPMSNQAGAAVKVSGFVTSRFNVDDSEVFAYTSGPGKPWFVMNTELNSLGLLESDRPLVLGKHELKLGSVKNNPGLSGISLRIAGEEKVIDVASARKFKMTGHISRQFKLGGSTVFFYLPTASEVQIIDLNSFATLAKIPLGTSATAAGKNVSFTATQTSAEAGDLASAQIIIDGVPADLGIVDLDETGFQVQGTASETTEFGGVRVFLLQATEPLGSPLWIFDVHSSAALAVLNPGESVKIGHSRVRWEGPIHFSGLQTKTDPGIPVMYLGFFVVIGGTILGMWSHKQIWVTPMTGGCRLAGKANRGPFLFHRDMNRLRERLVQPGSEFPPDGPPPSMTSQVLGSTQTLATT